MPTRGPQQKTEDVGRFADQALGGWPIRTLGGWPIRALGGLPIRTLGGLPMGRWSSLADNAEGVG